MSDRDYRPGRLPYDLNNIMIVIVLLGFCALVSAFNNPKGFTAGVWELLTTSDGLGEKARPHQP